MIEPRLITFCVTVLLVVAAPLHDDQPEPEADARPDDDVIILPGVTAEMIDSFRNHPFDN